MTLDLVLRNIGERKIRSVSLNVPMPHEVLAMRDPVWDDIPVTFENGVSKPLHFPGAIDIYATGFALSLRVTKIIFDDGEIFDANCLIGKATIPAAQEIYRVADDSKPLPMNIGISPPRMLSYNAPDLIPTTLGPRRTRVLSFKIVVNSDGTVRSSELLAGSEDAAINLQAEKSLKSMLLTPALLNGSPTAVEMPFVMNAMY